MLSIGRLDGFMVGLNVDYTMAAQEISKTKTITVDKIIQDYNLEKKSLLQN